MKNIKIIFVAISMSLLLISCNDTEVKKITREDAMETLGIPTVEQYQEEYTKDNSNIELENNNHNSNIEPENNNYNSNVETNIPTENKESEEDKNNSHITQQIERYIQYEYDVELEDLVYLNNIFFNNGEEVQVFVDCRQYGENNKIVLYFKTLDGFNIGQINYNGGYAIYSGEDNKIGISIDEMNKLCDPLMSIKTTVDMKYNKALKEWEEKSKNQQFTPINPVN